MRDSKNVNAFASHDGFDMVVAYDGSGRQEFVGIARTTTERGANKLQGKVTDPVFQIYKLAYDSSGRMTKRRYADSDDSFTKKFSERAGFNYVDI